MRPTSLSLSAATCASWSKTIFTHNYKRPTMDNTTRKRRIPCKEELIIQSLLQYYSSLPNLQEILPLLEGQTEISLRIIDWFVTNYAKKNNISYIIGGQEFVVYMNYKSQLKAYSKKLFDPFCRRSRISFQIPGHEPFITTVGKLNFFRWALEKGIIDYIRQNFKDIEREHALFQKETNNQRKTPNSSLSSLSSSGSSMTISTSASKKSQTMKRLHTHDTPVVVSFS